MSNSWTILSGVDFSDKAIQQRKAEQYQAALAAQNARKKSLYDNLSDRRWQDEINALNSLGYNFPSVSNSNAGNIGNGASTNSVGFTGDYANAPIAARGATGSGGSVNPNVDEGTIVVTPTTTPNTQRPSSAPRRQNTSGKGNAIKANPGNGRGSYNPTPNAIAEAQQEVAQVAQQPIAPVTDIFTGLPAAMQGNEYARAAANGDMANAVSAQALAEAPVAVAQQAAQQAQQSRYDQLMRDYALSQMADDVAIQRYIAQSPVQYGEDVGTLYDMLYGGN